MLLILPASHLLTYRSVIVASGLIALVDDCIKQHFSCKPKRQFVIPVPRVRMDLKYVGTKELFKGWMNRSNHDEATSGRPALLYSTSHVG